MKILPGEQLSAQWFQHHVGCVSGSYMSAVLDFTLKGVPGSKRKTYFRTKLAELLTGVAVHDNYVSQEMLDGIDREPLACAAYERETGVMLEPIGFCLHDTIPRFGCSPDRLVGDDGLIEVKCPKAGTHLQWLLDQRIPPEHLPQLLAELSVTGRAWADFVSFSPEMPKPLRTMIIRLERSAVDLEPIEKAVSQFNADVDAAIERLREIVGAFALPAAEAARKAESADYGDLGLTEEDLALLDGPEATQ
jgi:hypothetical protein